MSATNATTYYELPVFIATDKPAWLTDWNGAMNAIDTAIKEALTAGENAQTTANTATSSIATINDSLTTINTSLTTLTSTVTGLVGSVNTINSLIGNGEPTTSDKTLIGAINEIYGMITGGGGGNEIQASNVVYDNTTSGLTATDVNSAIDEVKGMISGAGYDFDLTAYTGTATVTSNAGTVDSGSTDVKYDLNADKSIGKIYGAIYLSSLTLSSGWTAIANIASSDFAGITTPYTMPIGFSMDRASGSLSPRNCRLSFKADGSIDVEVYSSSSASADAEVISLAPCIYLLAQKGA